MATSPGQSRCTPTPAGSIDHRRIAGADSEPHNWLAHGRTWSEQRYSPLDEITTEVDSSIWSATSSQFSAIDHDGFFRSFTGPNMEPLFETGALRGARTKKSRIGRIEPDMDGVTVTQVRSGETPGQLGVYGPEKPMIRGFTSHRVDCKSNNIHQIRVRGDSTFTYVSGIEAEVIRSGN